MVEPIRIAVIDDHPLFRQGVCLTLRGVPDMIVVGEGATAEDAVRICQHSAPAIVLLDVHIPGGGVQAARKIRETRIATKVIMLTVSESERDVRDSLQHGISGYVLKGISGEELLRILRMAWNGDSYISPHLGARLLGPTLAMVADTGYKRDPSGLTHRQTKIVQMLSQGLTNKEIGLRLGVAGKTVDHCMTELMRKLKARNRVEVVVIATKGSDTGERILDIRVN